MPNISAEENEKIKKAITDARTVLRNSFKNGLNALYDDKHLKTSPRATILKNDAGEPVGVRFSCRAPTDKLDFDALSNCKSMLAVQKIFPQLCEKYQDDIGSVDTSCEYYKETIAEGSKEDTPENSKKSMFRFDFHISPEVFDKILKLEEPAFQAYGALGDLSKLLNPEKPLSQKNTLFAFPVMVLEDGNQKTYLLRNSGCNIGETISVQLAEVMNELLKLGGNSALFRDHHISQWLIEQTTALETDFLLNLATQTLGIKEIITAQTSDGDTILNISEEHQECIKPMSDEAFQIYKSLSAVSEEELKHIHSAEIPMVSFLAALYHGIEDKIKRCYESALKNSDEDNEYIRDRIISLLINGHQTLQKIEKMISILNPEKKLEKNLSLDDQKIAEKIKPFQNSIAQEIEEATSDLDRLKDNPPHKDDIRKWNRNVQHAESLIKTLEKSKKQVNTFLSIQGLSNNTPEISATPPRRLGR